MSSNWANPGEIVGTLIYGIQLSATLLPLFGTDECADQLGSALKRGYINAAAAPMSVFGGLGVVRVGFMAFLACFSFGGIEGAKILMKLRFMPEFEGDNLSLIMLEVEGENTGHYVIETRMDKLIKDLNINKNQIIRVSYESASWVVKMMVATALLCSLGITPYIYLNLTADPDSNVAVPWIFPIFRLIGGFSTATLIQVLLQRRITTLSEQYLFKRNQRNKDEEAAGDTPVKKDQTLAQRIAPTWLLLFLLLTSVTASLIGYFGCYSVASNNPPIIWVFLETALSIIRSAICGYLPTSTNPPPLKILLYLDEYTPAPTCNKDNEEILQDKMLPLTRARDFLKTLTSFAGFIEPFNNPDFSLYYTLTRKRSFKKGEEWTLYITVFDHKGHTAQVYTRDNEIDTFYSTKSDAPLFDVGPFLRVSEVEIDVEIVSEQDTVASDSKILDSLRKHHQSILENIQYPPRATNVSEPYAIENRWTMKVEDAIGNFQRSRNENGDNWEIVIVEKRKEDSEGLLVNEGSLASGYSMHSSIESELDEERGSLIARRMGMIPKETEGGFQSEEEVEYRVNDLKQEVERKRNATI